MLTAKYGPYPEVSLSKDGASTCGLGFELGPHASQKYDCNGWIRPKGPVEIPIG